MPQSGGSERNERGVKLQYDNPAISYTDVPKAVLPVFQHIIDTYASETNKVVSTWRAFSDSDLNWKPHERSSTTRDIFKHQLLSERRFFAEFLALPEPSPNDILPNEEMVHAYVTRFVDLARPRLAILAEQQEPWWHTQVRFFETQRQRIWIFWRRILHTAHHRTQLTVYLRFLNKPVPSIYGPTADISWQGADPTTSIEAAQR